MHTFPSTIVIADDDQDDCELLSNAIKTSLPDATITFVSNGLKLLMLKNRTEPDVIFLDINMPVKNGIECLTEIRKSGKFKDTRVIMYSTSNSKRDINASFENSANFYLIKPGNYNALVLSIQRLLQDEHFINMTFPRKEEFVIGYDV